MIYISNDTEQNILEINGNFKGAVVAVLGEICIWKSKWSLRTLGPNEVLIIERNGNPLKISWGSKHNTENLNQKMNDKNRPLIFL